MADPVPEHDVTLTLSSSDLDRIDSIDRSIVEIAKSIRILSRLTWPAETRETFLAGWRAGNAAVPDVTLPQADHTEEIAALEALMARCDTDDPMGDHLHRTALSYVTVARMLDAIGTPAFTEHSIALYGRPGHIYEAQGMAVVDSAAAPVLQVTEDLLASNSVMATIAEFDAEKFASILREELGEFFTHDTVEVVVDPSMSAKAAAGARKVKVQAGAMFSDMDLAQLLNHEAFIHTATSLNGRHQKHLTVLGLGSPRTTKTQEGLAVFSELITYSMDVVRLRRIALRAIAVEAALQGANFIEVFEIYIDGGQTELDAYNSTQRIFRGGDPHGSIAFTKDGAYLEGLLLVQTFLRKAIADNRAHLIPLLFAGRMTLGDAIRLEPLFDAGILQPALYMPAWISGLRRLSAYLAYSLVSARIHMDRVKLENFTAHQQNGML